MNKCVLCVKKEIFAPECVEATLTNPPLGPLPWNGMCNYAIGLCPHFKTRDNNQRIYT